MQNFAPKKKYIPTYVHHLFLCRLITMLSKYIDFYINWVRVSQNFQIHVSMDHLINQIRLFLKNYNDKYTEQK